MRTMNIRRMLTISRPRFWMYLFGPFLLGATAAYLATGTIPLSGLFLALYFTFPANLYIYGVNDIFDFDTDVLNEKKKGYESVVQHSHHRAVWVAILATNIPFLVLLFFMSPSTTVAIAAFAILGYCYSAPPVRAKARPLLDSASNILYVMPGIAAFYAFGGTTISIPLVIAGMLWSMAMHAYSAVPDIAADTQAGLRTIATTFGAQGTLLFCFVSYAVAGTIAGVLLGTVGWIALGVYTAAIVMSFRSITNLMPIYKQFPLINTVMGAMLFFSMIL